MANRFAFQSQSAWFLPWLAQQSAELMFGVGFFIAYSLTGVNFSVQQGRKFRKNKAFHKLEGLIRYMRLRELATSSIRDSRSLLYKFLVVLHVED